MVMKKTSSNCHAGVSEAGAMRCRFPIAPSQAEQVLAELRQRLKGDMTFASGRIIGSMISPPHWLADHVFAQHLEKNASDHGVFPATAQIEREVIAMLGDLLNGTAVAGNVVTGGSEANIVALWAARNRAGDGRIEVIVPETAHVSYIKAADLLRLKLVKVPLTSAGIVDVHGVADAISSRTMAIVGMAGSTDLGMVDPIEELSRLALAHNLYLHVDAAFGGYVLPFLEASGDPVPAFDFRVPGVQSITIDPHKMGLCVQPAGCVIFRDADVARHIGTDIGYLAGGKTTQKTLSGTRSGAAVLAIWAVTIHLGRQGYAELIRGCMETTREICAAVEGTKSLEVVVPPVTNIVAIRSTVLPVSLLANGLRSRGWAVSEFPHHLRIVVMPNHDREVVEMFLHDLRNCVAAGLRSANGREVGDLKGSSKVRLQKT
jgi:tyrosine decarboxylase/aspartate 1-decarboxylase